MIKTWQQRCEEHPDHEGIVSEGMIRARMQEEIDELRQALAQPVDGVNMSQERVDETAKREHEWVGLDGDIPGLGLVTEEFYNGMLCAEDILRKRNT